MRAGEKQWVPGGPSEAPPPGGREAAEVERVIAPRVLLRPIGNPLPLGLLGLTAATLSMGRSTSAGSLPLSSTRSPSSSSPSPSVMTPTQASATVFGFLARDAVVASGIGVQAAAWFTTGLILLTTPPGR